MAIFNMVQGKVPMTYRGTKTIALFHFDDYIDNKTPVATVGNGMVNGTISPYLGIAHFGIVGKIDGGDNLKYKTSDLSFGTGPFTIEFFFFKNVWDTTSPLSRVDVSDNENVNKTYIYLSLTSSWTYHFNLGQVRRGEVDGQAPLPPGDAAGRQGGPHPLARLPHGGVGQADEREGRQARGAVGLDLDDVPRQAGEGDGEGARQSAHSPTPRWWRSTAGRPGRSTMDTTSMRSPQWATSCEAAQAPVRARSRASLAAVTAAAGGAAGWDARVLTSTHSKL